MRVFGWSVVTRFSRKQRIAAIAAILAAAMLGMHSWRAHGQRQAVAAISDQGGKVLYARAAPHWFRDLVGPDFVENIASVDLRPCRNAQVELAGFQHFPDLQSIYLSGTHVTDSSLICLSRMKCLRIVGLGGTRVANVGLSHLPISRDLWWINLEGTRITDSGLPHLKSMPRLQTLILGNTMVTDAGLAHLTSLTDLRTVFLNNTEISDAGLEHLKKLRKLSWLDVQQTRITAEGLAAFREASPRVNVVRSQDPAPPSPAGFTF